MTLNITRKDVGTVFEDGFEIRWRMLAWNDHGGEWPVVCVQVDKPEESSTFKMDGAFSFQRRSKLNLTHRVKPRLSGFMNVYGGGTCIIHASRESSDGRADDRRRIACIDLSQFEEGHGLD